MKTWLVTPHSSLAENWARALRGWRAEHALSLREFLSRTAGVRPGIALVDLRLAWPRPAEVVCRLRGEAPGWRIALWVGAEDAFGPSISRALESGADDVLSAAFEAGALASRLAALSAAPQALLGLGDGAIRLDRGRRLAWAGRARPRILDLTRTEFDLLALLLEHRGRPLSRDRLIEGAWGDGEVNPETVGRHIGSLRRKLRGLSGRIRTAHGYGYVAQ